jgi:vacuolar-type H+-ATPase catalytic subunit A/Vma1
VELGPGILNNIFDGIQRPLKQIAVASGDVFIPRGVAVPALDVSKSWEFHPTGFKVGMQGVHAAAASWNSHTAVAVVLVHSQLGELGS